MNKPKVSVCMITYNHEKYIAEAIKGVLMQVTDFDIEFIIANDASIDTTHSIITELAVNSKNVTFNYINHPVNIGMIPNFMLALKECSGKYLAICEGDDYWTDPLKLQKQVDFLEANHDFNLITASVRRFYQNADKYVDPTPFEDYTFTYKDMIVRNHCVTCITLIRNFIKNDGSFEFFDDRGADSQLWIKALGKTGKGRKVNEIMGVYRTHDGGVSAIAKKKMNAYNNQIASMERKISKAQFWNKYFGNEAEKSVLVVKKKMTKRMLKSALQWKKYGAVPFYFFRYVISSIRLGLEGLLKHH